MKRASTPLCLAAALGLMLGAAGTSATAQDQFTEDDLQSFAVAVVQIERINASVQQELQTIETPEEQQQMQQQAQAQMIQVIESEGMTVDDYNQIATAVQTDPNLAQRIEQHILEAQ
jgi:hypothetical protein